MDWAATPLVATAIRTVFRQVFRAWETLIWLSAQDLVLRELFWDYHQQDVWGEGSPAAAAYPGAWMGPYSDQALDSAIEFFSELGDMLVRGVASPGDFVPSGAQGIRTRFDTTTTLCFTSSAVSLQFPTNILLLCQKFSEDFTPGQQTAMIARVVSGGEWDARLAWMSAKDERIGGCRAGVEWDRGGEAEFCFGLFSQGSVSFDVSCNKTWRSEPAPDGETQQGETLIRTAYRDVLAMYEAVWFFIHRCSFLSHNERRLMWNYDHRPIPAGTGLGEDYPNDVENDPSPRQWFGVYSDTKFLQLREALRNIIDYIQNDKKRFFCWRADKSYYGTSAWGWITFYGTFWSDEYGGTRRRAKRRMLGHEILHGCPAYIDDGWDKLVDVKSTELCNDWPRHRCYGNDDSLDLRRGASSFFALHNIDNYRAWADNYFQRWGRCWPDAGQDGWVPPPFRWQFYGNIDSVEDPEIEPPEDRPSTSDPKPNTGGGRPDPSGPKPNTGSSSKPNPGSSPKPLPGG